MNYDQPDVTATAPHSSGTFSPAGVMRLAQENREVLRDRSSSNESPVASPPAASRRLEMFAMASVMKARRSEGEANPTNQTGHGRSALKSYCLIEKDASPTAFPFRFSDPGLISTRTFPLCPVAFSS